MAGGVTLLPVAEAQARLLALKSPLAPEAVSLDVAAGRWLAQDLLSLRDQPAANLSAMDGYAVRFADFPGPWQVIGTSAAGGTPPPAIGKGEAVRIFTGAPLPSGADIVIIQEDVSVSGVTFALNFGVTPSPRAGQHVRPTGSDFRQEQKIIPAGTRLSARHIALAALARHGNLNVHRRPRIAVLSTGSELVPPGAPVGPGQLPASNAVMLRAMLAALPCDIIDMGIVGDDLDALSHAFRAAAQADIVVTTGGASVGDHDLVKPALVAAGGSVDFWKIAMRPGKPLICGTLGQAAFLGLPGNPVSAYVTATLFLLPLVRHMAGSRDPLPKEVVAHAGAAIPATGTRAEYVRASMENGIATPLVFQDSAATLALSQANCLIHRTPQSPAIVAGDPVTILPLPA